MRRPLHLDSTGGDANTLEIDSICGEAYIYTCIYVYIYVKVKSVVIETVHV